MNTYHQLACHYDGLTGDVPYAAFADFYEKIFRLYDRQVKTVIDLACGTGSMTEELARRGYDLIAVDQSPDMLSAAMEKLSTLDPMPLMVCQSLEELDLYGTSDAAVCTLDGMNYLCPEGLCRALHRIRYFLEPGGLLIFDVNTPEKLQSLDGQIFLDENDDCFCVWRAVWDEEENACIYGIDLFEKSGRHWDRSCEEHIEYAHSAAFLRRALEEAGYTDIKVFGELKTETPA